MATVRFYLRDEKIDRETPITCYIFSQNEKLKYPTGEKINPKYWDKNSQRAIITGINDKAVIRRNKSINIQLNRFVDIIITIETTLKQKKLPLNSMNFKTGLDNELKEIHHQETQPEKTEHITLIEYLEKYINNVKFVFDPKYNIRPINDRTKNKYRTLLNFLVEFIEYQRIKTLKFDDIDLEFYQDFISFLQSEKRHSTNTIGKYIATLKAILNRATEEGINTCIKYKSKKFNSPREEVDKIYLSQSEIDKIYNLKFASAQTGLERARDLFLIGCNTALRFSDFTAIQPENIIKNDSGIFLKMTTYKTSQNVTIPLNPMVVSILEKYNYQLPKNISNQKMNDHLKVIGKMAGINDIISITKTIAGKSVTQQYKKYELISCHTARRTGATLMYLSGIPVLSIMMITGHKTEKVFRGYIRIDSEQNANLIKDNPFFKRIPGGMENSHLSIAN